VYNGMSGLSVFVTLLLLLVAYDQCELVMLPIDFESSIANLRIVMYIWNKGSIVGPAWKIPFVGLFLSSVNPKMDDYKAQFASGELSCLSVFHK